MKITPLALVLLAALVVVVLWGQSTPAMPDGFAAEVKSLTDVAPEYIQQTMMVSEAYAAIPHEQITYSPSESVLGVEEVAYLEQLFDLVDTAVVERVETQVKMQKGGLDEGASRNYQEILRQLVQLETPERLESVHQLIIAAVLEQKRYFDQASQDPSPQSLSMFDPLVWNSHQRLVEAYNQLMDQYP